MLSGLWHAWHRIQCLSFSSFRSSFVIIQSLVIMFKPKASLARLRRPILTIVAVFTAFIVGIFSFTDVPQQLGLFTASGGDSEQHQSHEQREQEFGADDHAGHDHAGHDQSTYDGGQFVELSQRARANLRMKTQEVVVGTYVSYAEVPGLVTRWPGETHISITSPLTGVISAISVSRGEMVRGGKPLFTLRLTHQDLVNAQEAFLRQLGQLDVEQQEIQRLTSVAERGAIAGKTRLAREYERDKLLASIRAARQSMMLHGLSEEQIESIERTRILIREVVVTAPLIEADNSLHHDTLGDTNHWTVDKQNVRLASLQPPPMSSPDHNHVDAEFLVTELDVRRGEAVAAGQQIAQLSDYSRLLIEGQAYQRDASLLRKIAESGAGLQAIIKGADDDNHIVSDLHVVYIGNEVGTESRALPFYVGLSNQIERSEQRGDKYYVSWRYKPGQRLILRLPQMQIENAIVVPRQAVVDEGPERFLFVENGDHFERVPVEILASDSVSVAVKNDGQIWPGQTIVVRGAHQLQMALKNQTAGVIDPHAGHNH